MAAMPPPPDARPRFADLERYYDARPTLRRRRPKTSVRSRCSSRPGCGRTTRDRASVSIATSSPRDVTAVRERQRALGVPETFEWVVETTPSMSAAAREAGLAVQELPLLIYDGSADATRRRPGRCHDPTGPARGIRPGPDPGRRVGARSRRAGRRSGRPGPRERDARAAADPIVPPRLRDRIRGGLTVLYVAEDDDGPIASGPTSRWTA